MEVRRALARVGLSLDDEAGAAAGAAGPAAGPAVPLGLAVGAYLAAVQAGGRSPETVRVYRTILRAFLGWAAGARPGATCADLGHELADAFVRHLREEHPTRGGAPLAGRTVHHYVTVLKIFARWGARGRRFWPVSPLADFETPAFTEGEIVPHSRAELTALLGACGADTSFMGRRLRAMLLVALDSGLRRGELRKVEVPMLELDTGRLRLPAAITKSRRPRTVHLQRAALAAVRAWLVARGTLPGVAPERGPLFCTLEGAALSDTALHELAVRLRARSGVARFRWHLLRHTAGTESLRNGADSLDVQEALGHATSEMTRRYLHLTDDDRRERHARFSPVEALLRDAEPRERRFRGGRAAGGGRGRPPD